MSATKSGRPAAGARVDAGSAAQDGLPTRAVVIGAGLIGASVGCALSGAGVTVHLRDARAGHARVAASRGAGTTSEPDARDVGLVVVAVPPEALPGVIHDALYEFPAATVTDVGSVKAEVLDVVWNRAAGLERYVGSHPMAGSHRSGPMTARPDLFVDRTWVITPHRRSAPYAVDRVRALVAACGARAVVMDVVAHDAAVARVSHLPHLISVLMAEHLLDVPDDHLALAGQGLRDVTRIAGSDPALWEQILRANSAAVLTELHLIDARLRSVIAAIENDAPGASGPALTPRSALRERLTAAVAGTRRIPGKHGQAPVAYSQVVVEIPDAPGALARLFADVEAAGVNVEDIAIEHDRVRPLGYLALSITPDQEPALVASMTAAGWEAARVSAPSVLDE